MNLKRRIKAMLTENTGRALCDSGDAYGRNYERNQGRKFESEPSCTVEIDSKYNEINVTFNLYHYLKTYLELNDVTSMLNRKFKRFANQPDNQDAPWLALMEEFAQSNSDDCEYYTTNTYNYDNILSQTLQYTIFRFHGLSYIILQIHGGCDVRGGYTKPHIFELPEPDYFQIAQSDIGAVCAKGHNWMSDDSGSHWYYEGSTAKNDKFDWSNIKLIDNKAICPCGAEIKFGVRDCY